MKNELSRKWDMYPARDFFDAAFRNFFPAYRGSGDGYMRTDIKETDNEYVMEVELPGADKKDIHMNIRDGYLDISVGRSDKTEEKDKHSYIRRERNYSCSRSYYVGDVNEKDVKAKYDNGVLTVHIPKQAPGAPEDHRINIE